MNDVENLANLLPTSMNQLDFLPTLFNFAICMCMAFIVREFYIRRSFSLTGKNHIGSILPLLSGIVFMVIIVVKSSLALSLGLVGALSIVRFRTPVKEPEELVYLFLAIAIGLGYGAGHILITTVLVVGLLVVTYFWLSNRKIGKNSEYNLVINWTRKEVMFDELSDILKTSVQSLKLVRLDKGESGNTAVLLVVPDVGQSLDMLISALQAKDASISCTFFEAKTNW